MRRSGWMGGEREEARTRPRRMTAAGGSKAKGTAAIVTTATTPTTDTDTKGSPVPSPPPSPTVSPLGRELPPYEPTPDIGLYECVSTRNQRG